MEIVAFDRPISSEQALAWGLVTKVAETLSTPPLSLTSSESDWDYPAVQLIPMARKD